MSRDGKLKVGIGVLALLIVGVVLVTRMGGPTGGGPTGNAPVGENAQDQGRSAPQFATFPTGDFELKPGEHVDVVQQNCLLCHSAAPIVQHEGFTDATWAAVVIKMRDRYGAPLGDEDATKVTQYLQEQYGLEAMAADS